MKVVFCCLNMKLIECMFFISLVASVQNSAKAVKDRWQATYPVIFGTPCHEVAAGMQVVLGQNITFTSNSSYEIDYKTSNLWRPGRYVCIWNVAVMDSQHEQTELEPTVVLSFRRLHMDSYYGECKDNLTLSSPKQGSYYRRELLCRYQTTVKYEFGSDTMQIRLEVEVPEGLVSEEQITSFSATLSATRNPNVPKRFRVVEIISSASSNTSVKDFNFTWQEGRDFCMGQYGVWDLCPFNDLCAMFGMRYNFGKNENLPFYFPMLDTQNMWGYVDTFTECRSFYHDHGPPTWGRDKKECPDNGCESKSDIFCCRRDKPYSYSYGTFRVPIEVNSMRMDSGKFVYRFEESKPEDYYEYHYEYSEWENDWSKVGRSIGDINMFELLYGYSPQYPTPVFFCIRVIDSERGDYRYKISLLPCKGLWYRERHLYTTTEPREGMTALYISPSSEDPDEGSRVSFIPPCCGFDYPERSFMIYAFFDEKWKADVPALNCDTDNEYTEASGTIKSPLFPNDYMQHMDCSWTIRVQNGYGILIQFDIFSLHGDANTKCSEYFVEFSTTDRKYGRVCGYNLPDDFVVDSNFLEVRFSSEQSYSGKFSFNFTSVPFRPPTPSVYHLPNVNATWNAAGQLCRSMGSTLCWKNEICPTQTDPYGGTFNGSRWVAVQDAYNEWVQVGNFDYEGTICSSHRDIFGPPDWGNSALSICEEHEDSVSNPCTLRRDEVFCCEYSVQFTESLAKIGYLPTGIQSLASPVRVNIAYFKTYFETCYWFGMGSQWSAPSYSIRVVAGTQRVVEDWEYFDYHDPTTEITEMVMSYPWKPPSSHSIGERRVVDYVTFSSKYEQGHFEQVVYFCRTQFSMHRHASSDTEKYEMRLNHCRFGWTMDFFLYAGKEQTDRAKVAFHVGKADSQGGSVCCRHNFQSFTIYVMDVGMT